MEFPKFSFKVSVFGSEDVGKKTLLRNFLNQFQTGIMRTIGAAVSTKKIKVLGIELSLNIHVFTPKEEFWNGIEQGGLLGHLVRHSHGAVMMYDITNAKTLNGVSKWIQAIKNNTEDIPVLLVGNKLDLKENQEISKEQVEKFKANNDVSSSMEISLKTGKNVERVFRKLTRLMVKKFVPDCRIVAKKPKIEKKRKKSKEKRKEKKEIK